MCLKCNRSSKSNLLKSNRVLISEVMSLKATNAGRGAGACRLFVGEVGQADSSSIAEVAISADLAWFSGEARTATIFACNADGAIVEEC